MKKKIILLIATATLFISVANSEVVISYDTPNIGDISTTTTYSVGSPAVTGNLISQNWVDGSWVGTQFPDSSDINEQKYVTGKASKYLETTINSEDHLSLQELKLGFTSNFSVDARWWNPVPSTFTMKQIATNGDDTTTQSITFEDTTNHNYQFNNYGNTLVMNADPNLTHGTLTARFEFDIPSNSSYNGGHNGVDLTNPSLVVSHTTLEETSVTEILYCWEQIPNTCPGNDEINEVETILDTFQDDLETIDLDFQNDFYEEVYFNPIDYYEFEEVEIEDIQEFEVTDVYLDDFMYEPEFIYESEPMIEDFDMSFEDEMYIEETFYEEPIFEDFKMLSSMDEEMFVEEFTTEEFIESFEEEFEMAMLDEEPVFEDEPIEFFEDEPLETASTEEEIIEEEIIEEQPLETKDEEIIEDAPEPEPSIDEKPITNEPKENTNAIEEETTDDIDSSKEEDIQEEETTEEKESPKIKESTEEEPNTETDIGSKQDTEISIEVKIAKIEERIKQDIKNEIQRLEVTLNVVNEIVSREMISQQPDISDYFAMNSSMIDNRKLPGDNPAFFIQADLSSYQQPIYLQQANLVGEDPVIQHKIKMQKHINKTNEAYKKLKELIDARNNI